MDIDSKLKELMDLFARTGRELNEIVKQNEKFIADEIRRIETAIQDTTEVCSRQQTGRLKDVRSLYEKRKKICNDKTAAGLRAAQTKFEEQIRNTEEFQSTMKNILKECMDTDEFFACVERRRKEASTKRKTVKDRLDRIKKGAQMSASEQLKEAAICHGEAQKEALVGLQKIFKDTMDCVREAGDGGGRRKN